MSAPPSFSSALDEATSKNAYEILSTRCLTEFSNNIRNNNGFLRRTREGHMADRRDMQFRQEGRKVFKQVVPMVAELMLTHLADEGIAPAQLSRLWLHQANKGMNDLIGAKVMGREPTRDEQPNVLQELRQYLLRRLDHRLLAPFRGPAGGQPRRHLLVRRGIFGGQCDRAEGRLAVAACFSH